MFSISLELVEVIMFKLRVACLLLLLTSCSSERILFFNGFASHSHLVAMEPLANTLADRGHEVTIVTPMNPSNKHPNITYYCPAAVLTLQDDLNVGGVVSIQTRIDSKYKDYFLQTGFLFDGHFKICQKYYESQEFKDWIKKSHFHLVIIDALAKECGLPLVHIFKAKSIIFSPHTVLNYDPDTHGWPADPSGTLVVEEHPILPDSFQNEKQVLLWYYAKINLLIPRYENYVREEMQLTDMPSLGDLERQTSLMFLNVHFSYEFARSLPPFVINIGGIHCKESQGLENGLIKTAIDDPQYDGFVFVSFGSYAQISAAPSDFLQKFFQAFKHFPSLKFLWKWEGEVPKHSLIPKNIFFYKWFPQQDVLAHHKCKGFITHGGLMSLQQSIFHGVPIIVIPFFGDQPVNARLANYNGNGIHLEPSELTERNLKDAIQELVYTDKYSSKAKEMSKDFKDRPMPPVETAVWWTEYALRHNNNSMSKLKPLGVGQYWWQRRMLHFWSLIFLLILITIASVIYVTIGIFRFVKHLLGRTDSSERKVMNKSTKKNK